MKDHLFSLFIQFRSNPDKPSDVSHFSFECPKCSSPQFRRCRLHGASVYLVCLRCDHVCTVYQLFKRMWVKGFVAK